MRCCGHLKDIKYFKRYKNLLKYFIKRTNFLNFQLLQKVPLSFPINLTNLKNCYSIDISPSKKLLHFSQPFILKTYFSANLTRLRLSESLLK